MIDDNEDDRGWVVVVWQGCPACARGNLVQFPFVGKRKIGKVRGGDLEKNKEYCRDVYIFETNQADLFM